MAGLGRTVTIDVTPRNIKRGERMHPQNDPVAIATRRVLRGWQASVSYSRITVWNRRGVHMHAKLPGPVSSFLRRFDDGKPVKPITFTVKLRPVQPARVVKGGESND